MAWNVELQTQGNKAYVYMRETYRVGSNVKCRRIYLGPSEVASKILGDMQTKHLIGEDELSYSGEIILTKLADSLGFGGVLTRYTKDRRVGNVLKNIVILRTLFPESKRALVLKRLEHSILKDSTDLRYLEEVYHFMDVIYEHLGDILYGLVKNAVRKYPVDLRYLIIDATRLKVYKDEETDLIQFGYSGKERRDLPQANLIMGVNGQQIPFFVEVYPGNTADTEMFKGFTKHIRRRYRFLTEKISNKIIMILDQGNVNEDNIRYIRKFKKDGVYFVAMVRTQSMDRFIKQVDRSKMNVVSTKKESENETDTYGTLIEGEMYGEDSHVLICYSPDIAKHKCKKLDKRVAAIKERVESLNESNKSLDDRYSEIASLIEKNSLKRAIKPIKDEKNEKLELEVDDDELSARRERYGFFGVFTNHKDLSDKELITTYKTRDLVEKGFEVLKSELEICPVNHSRDDRIETHAVLVIYGYFLLSLLRAILNANGIEYSFSGLKDTIKSRHAVVGYFEHEQLRDKRLRIMRPGKADKKLEKIFKVLGVKTPQFDIK